MSDTTGPQQGSPFRFRRPAAQAPFIFLHIPKAAGSTFNSLVRMQYSNSQIKDFQASRIREEVGEFIARDRAEKTHYRAFLGHVPFGLHAHLDDAAGYVSVLRDPVARTISDYEYIKRTKSHRAHDRVAGSGMTLSQFVEKRLGSGQVNLQTIWLSGAIPLDWIGTPGRFWDESDAELLERAKLNIEQFFFSVAPLEEFNAFVLVLARLLGWRFPMFAKQNTASSATDTLDPALRSELETHCRPDRELYDHVRARFAMQKSIVGIADRDLRSLNRRNAVYRGLDGLRKRIGTA